MNIAHVVDNLAIGGLERLVVDLAKTQKKAGHYSAVACLRPDQGELVSELRDSSIDVLTISKKPGFDPMAVRSLVRFFSGKKIDVVHTHNPAANLYGAIGGRLAGVKGAVTTRHGMGNFPFDRKRETVFRFSTLFTHRVVFVCKAAMENFKAAGLSDAKKSMVIYNGVPIEKFQSQDYSKTRDIRSALNIGADDKVVGTVARLNRVKRLDALIGSARELVSRDSSVKFLIVGDGPERTALESMAKETGVDKNVIFLGARMDVAELLQVFDVFVLPSLSEGVSLTLVEAMISGKAVVATDVGGNPEVVEDGLTGLLVPPGDDKALTAAIRTLLAARGIREDMGREGRSKALRLFGIDRMAGDYDTAYKEAAGMRM